MCPNNSSSQTKMDYKSSGVDVEKADKIVDWMGKNETKTPDPNKDCLVSGIGGFAALFKGSFKELKDPLLVSSTDGIGTKLLMGLKSGHTKGLAQDLVGMCVNDLLCMGASPLFFLDYFATSNLDEDQLKEFFSALKEACHISGTSLIGGETAELPGLYQKGHFDAAGFSVGVVDRAEVFSKEKVRAGDRVLCIASSGFHSNGYSLLRKVFGEDGGEYAKELMTPTQLYWPLFKEIFAMDLKKSFHACAHITGGGMDNISRVLPDDLGVEIKEWEMPEIFKVAQKKSNLSKEEMYKTFNCGVGLVLIVDPSSFDKVKTYVHNTSNYKVVSQGVVVKAQNKWTIKV